MSTNIGIVGYGLGGRYFHAPFVDAAEGITLGGIVTRSDSRVAQAAADFPGVPVFSSLGELIDSGVDAVTITTHRRRDANSCSKHSGVACTWSRTSLSRRISRRPASW
jgi:predicted dehydrogenase